MESTQENIPKKSVSLSEINDAPNDNTNNNYIENYFNVLSELSKDKDSSSKQENNSDKNNSGEKKEHQTSKEKSSENENSNNANNNGNSHNVSLLLDPNSISSIKAEFEGEINALETKFDERFEEIEGNIAALNEKYSNIESYIKEIKEHLLNLNLDKKSQNDAKNNDNKSFICC